MMKLLVFYFCLILLLSCTTKTQEQDPQKAKQLYDTAMSILSERIEIQAIDTAKTTRLNSEAIKLFSAAYHLDTTFTNAALFASECTLFAKDYEASIVWLHRHRRLDTALRISVGNYILIGLCYVNLGELQKSKSYFDKAFTLWKGSDHGDISLLKENLLEISNDIFEERDPDQQKLLSNKGLSPCNYSIDILSYLRSLYSTKSLDSLIAQRKAECLYPETCK